MWGSCVTSAGIATLSCATAIYKLTLGIALDLIGTVSLFMIIFAGIKYITSGGGKQVEEAKNIFTYALIGLIVVLLAYTIVNFIAGIAGVRCILFFGFFGQNSCNP